MSGGKPVVQQVGEDWTVNYEAGTTLVKASGKAGDERANVQIGQKADPEPFAADLSAAELRSMAAYLTDIADRLDPDGAVIGVNQMMRSAFIAGYHIGYSPNSEPENDQAEWQNWFQARGG